MKKRIIAIVMTVLLLFPLGVGPVMAAGSADGGNDLIGTSGNVRTYRILENALGDGIDARYSHKYPNSTEEDYAARVELYVCDRNSNGSYSPTYTASAYNMAFTKDTADNVLTLGGNYWYCVDTDGAARTGLGNSQNTVAFSSGSRTTSGATFRIYAHPTDIPMTSKQDLVTVSQKNVVTDSASGHGTEKRKVEVYLDGLKVDEISSGGNNTVLFPKRSDGMREDDIVVTETLAASSYTYSGVTVDRSSKTYKINFTSPNVSRILYVANDGSNGMIEKKASDSREIISNPFTTNGKKFVSWNTSADGRGTIYLPGKAIPNGDTVLYAIWESQIYKVTLVLNGADSCASLTSYVSGQQTVLPTPVRANYSFNGWYSDPDFRGGRTVYIEITDIGNKTFYASWSGTLMCSITFDAQNGTEASHTTAKNGTVFSRPSAPVKDGAQFVAWYTSTAYTDVWDFSSDVCERDMTLYAKWTTDMASELANARAAAKAAISSAAGSSVSEAVGFAVTDANREIDRAETVENIEAAKNRGVRSIAAQKKADTLTSAKTNAYSELETAAARYDYSKMLDILVDCKAELNNANSEDEISTIKARGLARISEAGNPSSSSSGTALTPKEQAKAEVKAGAGDNPSSSIQNTVDEYCSKIDNATTEGEISSLRDEALDIIWLKLHTSDDISGKKDSAKATLISKLASVGGNKDLIYSEFARDIDEAESEEDIEKILATAEKTVEALKNSTSLISAKESAKNEIKSLLGANPSDEVKKIADEYIASVDGAKSAEEIEMLLMQVKSKISELGGTSDPVVTDTNTDTDTDVLKEKKAEAKKKIDEIVRDEEITDEIKKYVALAKEGIDLSADEDELEKTLEEALAELGNYLGTELKKAKKEAKEKLGKAVDAKDSDEKKKVFEEAAEAVENAKSAEEVEKILSEVLDDWKKWDEEKNMSSVKKNALATIDKLLETELSSGDKKALKSAREKITELESDRSIERVLGEVLKSIDAEVGEVTDPEDKKDLDEIKKEAIDDVKKTAGDTPTDDVIEAIEEATLEINKAETEDGVRKAKEAAELIIKGLTGAVTLEIAKNELTEELKDAIGDDPSELILDAYNAIGEKIKAAEDIGALAKLREEALDEITALVAKADILREAEDVKASIAALVGTNPSDEVKKVLDDVDARLDGATTYDEINAIREDALSRLAALIRKESGTVEYKITSGEGSKWSGKDGGDLSFTSNAPYEKYVRVEIDGKILVDKYVEVEDRDGETLVSVKKGYLVSLTDGKHSIKVVSLDGEAETSFAVKDNIAKPIWQSWIFWVVVGVLVLGGGAGLTWFIIRRKQDEALF